MYTDATMRFSTRTLHCGLFLLTAGIFSDTLSASITYQMLPQAVSKPGWSFDGGYITTDGTLGRISLQNFVDWSVSFTSPYGTHSISRNNGFVTLMIESFVLDLGYYGVEYSTLGLVATDQYLGIPPVERSNKISVLDFIFSSSNIFEPSKLPEPRLSFGRTSPSGKAASLSFVVNKGTEINSTLLPGIPPADIENNETSPRFASFEYADDGWIAVVVPEPASSILLCGIVSIFAMSRRLIIFHSGR
jgi:hypothetical protein